MSISEIDGSVSIGSDVNSRWVDPVGSAFDDLLREAVGGIRRPVRIVDYRRNVRLPVVGQSIANSPDMSVGVLPPILPELLGGGGFSEFHGCRFAYVVGEMAHGITTSEMVISAARGGLLPFFGSAGLRPEVVSAAFTEIGNRLPPGKPWGANLIYSPNHPGREREIVDVLLDHGVRRMSASAFLKLTHEVVRYSARGLSRSRGGDILRTTHVFAKVSRPETARKFMSPPPVRILRDLVAGGQISAEQAELHSRLPVSEDVTVEADSGGHTDNRPLPALLPSVARVRDELIEKFGYERPIRIGAAGGIGTPHAVAAAYQLGADYVLTGSINQSAIEAGLSLEGRSLLGKIGMADVTMAPAADMFEAGVNVQVVKRGTSFAMTAKRLHALYRKYDEIADLPKGDREWLENSCLREPFDIAWEKTRAYHLKNNPHTLAKADENSKCRMALVFRRFLSMGSLWARDGVRDRRADYQIWCGPAMGAFNAWVASSFLEPIENRCVQQIALNLMEGAAMATRAQQLRACGVRVPSKMFDFRPRRIDPEESRHHPVA